MPLVTPNKDDIKDITQYIRSISPNAIENICLYLKLQGIDKDVFLLRYKYKMSIENVAERLSISVATVNRTILRLKTMLAIEVVKQSENSYL